MTERTKVGVGVLIFKEGKVLLGQRKNAHGEGTWCPPGGHLEFKESWGDCAKRETLEETGVNINKLQYLTATNDIFEKENKHYVTIIMTADHDSGEAKIMEPEKCMRWDWFLWKDLPDPLFTPIQNLIKSGYTPEQ